MRRRAYLNGLGVCLVALACAVSLRAEAPQATAGQAAPQAGQAAAPNDPARLYRQHCQTCHGIAGKTDVEGMSFVGRTWKHGTASAQMAVTITTGVPGTPMLPFRGKLTPDQIQALAKYVRAFDTRLEPEK